MEEEKTQKELFEFEKPKKSFFRLPEMFSRARFEGPRFALTLTLEKLIFLSIAVIMLTVVLYALGVERGRHAVERKGLRFASEGAPVPKAATPSAVSATLSAVPIRPAPIQKANLRPPALDAATVKYVAKPYTIVAVTFSQRATAVMEANRLKKEGFEAYLSSSDPYFLVCVGAFTDKTSSDAQRELMRVRHAYKDAYLKLR